MDKIKRLWKAMRTGTREVPKLKKRRNCTATESVCRTSSSDVPSSEECEDVELQLEAAHAGQAICSASGAGPAPETPAWMLGVMTGRGSPQLVAHTAIVQWSHMLSSSTCTSEVRHIVIGALCSVWPASKTLRLAVLRELELTIPPLVHVLLQEETPSIVNGAILLLRAMCVVQRASVPGRRPWETLSAAANIPVLTQQLEVPDKRDRAVGALLHLADVSGALRVEMIQAGVAPIVESLREYFGGDLKQAAQRLLIRLGYNMGNLSREQLTLLGRLCKRHQNAIDRVASLVRAITRDSGSCTALLNLAQSSPRVTQMVMEGGGIAKLLDIAEASYEVEGAPELLKHVLFHGQFHSAAQAHGLVPYMLTQLKFGHTAVGYSTSACEQALHVLQHLTKTHADRPSFSREMFSNDAILPLVHLAPPYGNSPAQIAQAATDLLYDLGEDARLTDDIARSVRVQTRLLCSVDATSKAAAARALCDMASGPLRPAMAPAGAVEPLVKFVLKCRRCELYLDAWAQRPSKVSYRYDAEAEAASLGWAVCALRQLGGACSTVRDRITEVCEMVAASLAARGADDEAQMHAAWAGEMLVSVCKKAEASLSRHGTARNSDSSCTC